MPHINKQRSPCVLAVTIRLFEPRSQICQISSFFSFFNFMLLLPDLASFWGVKVSSLWAAKPSDLTMCCSVTFWCQTATSPSVQMITCVPSLEFSLSHTHSQCNNKWEQFYWSFRLYSYGTCMDKTGDRGAYTTNSCFCFIYCSCPPNCKLSESEWK